MKVSAYLSYSLFIALVLAISSCSDLVEGLNDDPNNPTSAAYPYILTGAEVGNIVLQNGETARKACIFSGQYRGIDRQHLGFSQYSVTTSDFDSEWNNVYVDVVANTNAAEEEGAVGIARGIVLALRAMALGSAASLWGDIPTLESGQPTIENPAFVQQTEAYQQIQSLLDEALIELASGHGRPDARSDIYLDGDPVAWTQVVHTLKARYYMHTKQYDLAYTESLAGIASPDQSLIAPHGNAAENANLNYSFFAVETRQADLVVSDFMDALINPDASSSPDISLYRGHSKTVESGRYAYLFHRTGFGIQPNTTPGAYAATDAPGYLVSYAENSLILAEAGARVHGMETGLGHLNDYRIYLANGGYMTNASASELKYDAFDMADFSSGGIENNDGIAPIDALLREILQERYVTLFGQIEVFNDVRRTLHESTIRVPVAPNAGSQLPARFLYPTTEIDRNPNVPNPVPGFFDPTRINQ